MDRYLDSSWKVSIFIIHKTKDVRNGTNQDQQSRVGKHCYWKKNIFNQLFTVELELYCIVLQYFNIFQWNGFIFVWKFNWNLVSYATIIIIRFIGLKLLIKYIILTFLCPCQSNFFFIPKGDKKKKHLLYPYCLASNSAQFMIYSLLWPLFLPRFPPSR